MKSFTQKVLLSLFLLTAFAGLSAHAQTAGGWNRRGQAAEAREDYDAAYSAYRQAHLKSPKDLRYKTHFERMKFQAGAQHVDRGRVLRQSGDLGGALAEFLRALEIDPTNQTAQQEADLVRQQANPPQAASAPTAPTEQDATLKAIGSVSAPIELQPIQNEAVTLHMVEDTKVIYQAIGKAIGINILFDPEYTSKRIPVDLTSVTWQDSLRIVGILSGTFWKPVTSNTIFVAQNTRTKRSDLDQLAVQTFYLTNASQQNDGNEVTTALRNLLDPSVKVYLIPGQNAIVMRATPDQLLLAEKLINDLDRAKPEVVVDVAVLEVSRDKIRNLGISLPNQFGITLQSGASTTTTSTGSSSSTGSSTTTPSNLTLNQLGHINGTNFAVTINAATVNALLTDSDTRVLQNPRIRATDGQRATLKIGSKIPVATGSYNAGAATGIGASLGVQTQFTYLDVGVNIDMTPTVHYDREISLKMKIEVSSHTGDQTISGVTEPIISQRVIDQVIQLKEGEPSILAGILQKQDTRNSSGTPGLGELPLLKYFFGSQFKEQSTDEVVFLLIPHIVRESVLTRLNTRPIDTGTGTSIELRRDPEPTPIVVPQSATATRAANTPPPPPPGADLANMSPGLPTSAPNSPPMTAANAVNAAAAQLSEAQQAQAPLAIAVMPPVGTQAVGSTFQLAVTVANAHDLYSVPMQLQFNPNVLSLVNVDSGDFLGRDGQAVAVVHRDEGGSVTISASRPPNVNGISGAGTLCTLTFKALAAGDTPIAFVRVGGKNSAQVNLPTAGTQAVVHVK